MSAFERLHPAIQYHVVNSMGWRALRPLQDAAIDPILAGEHALLLAPTAGGKTEAAMFPLLSRMLAENWSGTSVLYVCPIKALLNNLEARLARYATLVGRRVALWHGDVGQGDRRRIVAEPPDILLTTPESVEAMLIFRRADHAGLFGNLRAAVVDELHAFAGDHRGWHLLSVLERASRVAGRDLQRIGLSATIGNPEELLGWLAGSAKGNRCVVNPPADDPMPPEVLVDHVGSLDNAAVVISRLHRGEKRLVFCDSRSRTEKLASALRGLGVSTFVSHSSLSTDERRRAETAFSEARDCVIVATSTLELGVDVGDLDRVIQIDAPGTVASFLQRLGRTGRRPDTRRNCLFLATTDEALLQAAGLLHLWSTGYVEPVEPPPEPFQVFAQQILALVLQEGRIGRHTWSEWIGRVPGFVQMRPENVAAILDHMVASGILVEDEGMLAIGPEGEREYGRKNFLEVCSVFLSPPEFTVFHGREELGRVHESTFAAPRDGPAVLSLAGRSWTVKSLDWTRRVAYVEPSAGRGRSRWLGDPRPLGFALCRAMRSVLASDETSHHWSRRAAEKLAELREEFAWVEERHTTLLREADGTLRWWTFAGAAANRALAAALGCEEPGKRGVENLSLAVDEVSTDALCETAAQGLSAPAPVSPARDRKDVKFEACLPSSLVASASSAFARAHALAVCSTPVVATGLDSAAGEST
ncbi:MAG: DEAD/DEAH box helicase [Planctomycetes bacterium]|nr:DEAD/DEAH box helicase [Planctomycetota bacterium]